MLVAWRTTVRKKGEGNIGVLEWSGATALKKTFMTLDADAEAQATALK
jgi:hypothetical protein